MRILVDADACPVRKIIVEIAKQNKIPVIMFIDNCHIISNDNYSKIITVDKGNDSVDLYLVNQIQKGDIVITQDYGLAAIALARSAEVISFSGLVFNNSNIDSLLLLRHTSSKIRRAGGKLPSIKKRTKDDDIVFESSLKNIITKNDG